MKRTLYPLLHLSIVLCVLLTGFFGSCLFTAPKVSAVNVAGEIKLEPNTQEAEVAPGQSGVVMFMGTVKLMEAFFGQQVQKVVVGLRAETDQGWPCSISPSSMVLDPNRGDDTGTFTVTVTVTPRTSYTVRGTLKVSGDATPFPGALKYPLTEGTGIITIKQFYRFSIGCESPFVQVMPGSAITFTIVIRNEGNGVDKFGIDIPNKAQLVKQGWSVQLSSPTIEVPEGGEDNFMISLTTPLDWTVYKVKLNEIQIRVYSKQRLELEGMLTEEQFSVYVREKGYYIPGFDAGILILCLALVATYFGASKKVRHYRKT